MHRFLVNNLVLALFALLLAACGGGGGGNKGGNARPPPPAASVTVSGMLSYEFVRPNPNCNGLNFGDIEVRPIRGATVQLLDGGGAELARVTSSNVGGYSFPDVPSQSSVRVRVLAQLLATGVPSWNVEVRDNVDTSATPPPLASRPMYSLDSSVFNTGSSDVSLNLTAETGWTGSAYTQPRAAAPFAILDTIYTGLQFLLTFEPTLTLPPLDAFWSVNNTADADETDIDSGDLGGSFYDFGSQALFLTGDADGDTEEFDDHIVAHEWGHFLDDALFRSDSSGGTHFLGDRLDSRVAWGEGWPSAFAAIYLDNPLYCETGTPGTSEGFGVNAEAGIFGGVGWFDEVGVIRFVYDLWDTTNEGTDTGSIGFAPIYEVMRNGHRNTPAWANIYTFAVELKALVDASGDALIDAQLADEQTVNGAALDIWASQETNDGGADQPGDVLPVYIDMVADGTTENICSDSQFDLRPDKDGNKLAEFRYIRLSVPLTDEYDVHIESTTATPATPDPDDRDQSDPDMLIVSNGVLVADLRSGAENVESGTTQELAPGTYVADLRDWRYADPERPDSYPPKVCFDVRFSPTP